MLHRTSYLALTHQEMDRGPLGMSGTRALVAGPLSPVGCKVGLNLLWHILWILNWIGKWGIQRPEQKLKLFFTFVRPFQNRGCTYSEMVFGCVVRVQLHIKKMVKCKGKAALLSLYDELYNKIVRLVWRVSPKPLRQSVLPHWANLT